jgi:ATP-dependent Clp protease ATP-binding subunit ClpA
MRQFAQAPGSRPVAIEVDEAAADYIVSHGYQREFGARSATTYIDTEVAGIIATEILRRRVERGGMYLPAKVSITCDGAGLKVIL